MKKILLVSLVFIGGMVSFFALGRADTASAGSGCNGVIISEFMANPEEEETDYEWVELQNTTTSNVDISGCKIEDMEGVTKQNVFPSGTIVRANSYFFIYRKDMKTKITLNNASEGLKLLDSDNTLIFQTDLSGADKEGQSFAYNGKKWLWTSRPTPGAENKFDTVVTTSNGSDTTASSEKNSCVGIIISELMPDAPEGQQDSESEWIELHNTQSHSVKIGGCKLRDLRGSVKTYTIPNGKTIPAEGYAVFFSKDTPLSMNNDEDGIALLSSSGSVVFQTAIYKDGDEGNGFAYDGESWEWTSTPTPGKANVLTRPSEKGKKKKSKAKKKNVKKDSDKDSRSTEESSGEVLGANTSGDTSKVNDKMMGYFMVALSFAFLVGYIGWTKKDLINENIIKKFRGNS